MNKIIINERNIKLMACTIYLLGGKFKTFDRYTVSNSLLQRVFRQKKNSE